MCMHHYNIWKETHIETVMMILIHLFNSHVIMFEYSVRPSVRLSHIFHFVPIIVSSWNFEELLPLTDVMSMQKVKVKGQGHRGHDPI